MLFALLGTVALDRLWGARLGERTRLTLLALWTLSPCLLLYARMCRSYTLQALCAIVAAAMLVRFAEKSTRRNAALLALALLAALYTHYVAGIALIATANLTLFYRRRWRPALAIDCAIAIGYLPWIWRLAASLASWGANSRNYTLTGSRMLEVPVKFAYWSMSFVMGEAVPDAVLVLGALLLPLLAAVAWQGARRTPELAWLAAALGAIGFIGVARWVSYPFVPARMLFVLPFFLLLVAHGAARGADGPPRWGNPAVAAMLLLSLSGVWCYFHKTGFRNKQYPMPIQEIAGRILRDSRAGDSAILVDSTNSDPTPPPPVPLYVPAFADQPAGNPSRVDPPAGRPAGSHGLVPAQYPRRLARRTQRAIPSPAPHPHGGNRTPIRALHTAGTLHNGHPRGHPRSPAIFSRIERVPALE